MVLTLPGMDHDPDGPAAAADLSARIAVATQAVTATAADLTDAQAREPSRLPGWSRGHVLTHLARNADSLRNLLIWARTGVETPQYASVDEREAGITEGAGRPAAELRADIEATGAEFAAEAASLRAGDWDATVRGLRGAGHPAWYTLWRRLTEVEIHHVDLGAGYRPADWPPAFSGQLLARLGVELQAPNVPRVTLHASGTGASYTVGQAEPGTGENEPDSPIKGPFRCHASGALTVIL